MPFNVAVIEGDGIGKEIVNSALKVIERLKAKYSLDVNLIKVEAGDNALSKYGEALPKESLKILDNVDAILKGPVGETAFDVVVKMRQRYDLYANLRPAKSMPNVETPFKGVDILVVRENTEDLYKGIEFEMDELAIALKVISYKSSKRIAEVALEYSKKRKNKVTIVHKSNVMRITDGLFSKACKEVLKGKVELDEMYVDAASAALVKRPWSFDVIVTENVYGDILSDEAAQVAGSLGIAPSANLGKGKGLFEPVHGAAFDISGKGIANPTAILLSTSMMFDFLGKREGKFLRASKDIVEAVESVYREGKKLTPDVGGNSKTDEFTEEVLKRL
jgi:3-isopropylmalate dehydrogenase